MVSVLRSAAVLLLAAGVAVPLVAAQPPTPGADDVKALREAFQAEREQAVKAKFPADALVKADELMRRADEAAKGENYKAALRHVRDARWQLPYLPAGLPSHVTRVLGEARMRHSDRVNALAYSPEGRLASASRDFTVKIWDLGNGRELVTYRGHVDQADDPTKTSTNVLGATDVAFHPKEQVVASSSGNQVHLWDPATGKLIKVLLHLGKTDKPINSIAFSPDGKLLAVGGDDFILRVIASDSGKEVFKSNSRNARIERVAFSPNGKLVALGDSNSQVAVYVPQGKGNQLAMSVQGVDRGGVFGVAFAADSGSVFTCGLDEKARLTAGPEPDGKSTGNTATKLREFVGHSGAVNRLALTADGKTLVTCGEDRTVRVWDVPSGKALRSFQGHMTKAITVAVRGDGQQVASASEDGAVRVWDLNAADEHRALKDAKESLWAVAASPDGKWVAAAGADKSIRVYSMETGKLEATIDAGAAMTALVFLDGNRLVASGGDKVVKVWDLAAKKVLKELGGHTLAVLTVAASPDGKLVVSGSADASVRGFAPDSGKEVWKWSSRKAAVAVAVRADGKRVAVGIADGGLSLLDVSGPAARELSTLAAHTAGTTCVAFSPDGNRLASVGGDGALRVWSVGTDGALTQLVRFDGPVTTTGAAAAPLSTVAFAPDGRYVASAGADAVVRVWDIQTKSEARGLRGHTDWVTSVAFSPNGQSLVAVAAEKDNTLRIFELPQLDAASAAGGHMLAVNAVAVSPNGKLVATAAIDQTIKVWDIATGKEVATLVGNADTPFAVSFLGNDALVMGGSLPTRDSGRLHLWALNPPRSTAVPTGEVYTVVTASDAARFGAWASRQAVGDTVKNNAYEIYDAKGKLLSSTPDKGRNVRSATFTPDLAWAVAGDESGTLRVFDLEKGERIGGDWPVFQRGFADLGLTADKKLLVAADEEGTIKIADVAKRDVIADGPAHKAGVRALVVSPTGKTFVTLSNDREIKAWSLTEFKDKKIVEVRSWVVPVTINGAAYTPDGKSVVTANADGTAYVLELP
ncbi:WD40 repeat domain-containing protein [Gemmata sp. JC673]|uniref:WD40 repeat domain-containing protein n=1 Tax=Gemmata algarum TaxID=2975278 RepID=A0ABU5EVX3_9BACT|nr:WD40 repeat domain-containing protein [Gemmata algarum]MDY3557968.1 WD40 repeat domain-containing protein [Gemmata algarum]